MQYSNGSGMRRETEKSRLHFVAERNKCSDRSVARSSRAARSFALSGRRCPGRCPVSS